MVNVLNIRLTLDGMSGAVYLAAVMSEAELNQPDWI